MSSATRARAHGLMNITVNADSVTHVVTRNKIVAFLSEKYKKVLCIFAIKDLSF